MNKDAPTAQGHAPTQVTQGTPVTIATTVQPQPQPVNPLLSADNWMPVLLFVAAVAAIMGLFTKHLSGKIREAQDGHKPAHEAIDKSLHRLANDITTDRARIHQLEQFRHADVERIVRLETNLTNIEKGQARIEAAVERMNGDLGDRIDGWAEQFSASIREVRDVKPRG